MSSFISRLSAKRDKPSSRTNPPSSNPTNLPEELLDFKNVAMFPPPGFGFPTSLSFSPNDKVISFLAPVADNGSSARHLYCLDFETGKSRMLVAQPKATDTEANLSKEEKLRRERQRRMTTGISSYSWTTGGKHRAVVPQQGNIYVADSTDNAELRCVFDKEANFGKNGVKAGSPAIDARFSPDGSRVAFVQDSEVYVVPAPDGATSPAESVQITSGARGTGKTNGIADYCAQEEMDRYV
jgi:dipeptidyl-peptidase-4